MPGSSVLLPDFSFLKSDRPGKTKLMTGPRKLQRDPRGWKEAPLPGGARKEGPGAPLLFLRRPGSRAFPSRRGARSAGSLFLPVVPLAAARLCSGLTYFRRQIPGVPTARARARPPAPSASPTLLRPSLPAPPLPAAAPTPQRCSFPEQVSLLWGAPAPSKQERLATRLFSRAGGSLVRHGELRASSAASLNSGFLGRPARLDWGPARDLRRRRRPCGAHPEYSLPKHLPCPASGDRPRADPPIFLCLSCPLA